MARLTLAVLAAAVLQCAAFSCPGAGVGIISLRSSTARVAAVPALCMKGFGEKPAAKKTSAIAQDRKRVCAESMAGRRCTCVRFCLH